MGSIQNHCSFMSIPKDVSQSYGNQSWIQKHNENIADTRKDKQQPEKSMTLRQKLT